MGTAGGGDGGGDEEEAFRGALRPAQQLAEEAARRRAGHCRQDQPAPADGPGAPSGHAVRSQTRLVTLLTRPPSSCSWSRFLVASSWPDDESALVLRGLGCWGLQERGAERGAVHVHGAVTRRRDGQEPNGASLVPLQPKIRMRIERPGFLGAVCVWLG